MINSIINMNLSDQYYPDLFLLNKTMFFVQKFIIIIFLLDSSVNKDSRQMSISDNPPGEQLVHRHKSLLTMVHIKFNQREIQKRKIV